MKKLYLLILLNAFILSCSNKQNNDREEHLNQDSINNELELQDYLKRESFIENEIKYTIKGVNTGISKIQFDSVQSELYKKWNKINKNESLIDGKYEVNGFIVNEIRGLFNDGKLYGVLLKGGDFPYDDNFTMLVESQIQNLEITLKQKYGDYESFNYKEANKDNPNNGTPSNNDILMWYEAQQKSFYTMPFGLRSYTIGDKLIEIDIYPTRNNYYCLSLNICLRSIRNEKRNKTIEKKKQKLKEEAENNSLF